MSIFTIGDLHLSLSSEKPMDIFEGWGNYTQRLERCWNAVVKPTDTVILPGDISWAMKLEEAVADFSFIHRLSGNKIILKGNHDYWWSTQKKMQEWLDEHQFSSIRFLFNNAYAVEDVGVCGTRSWFYDADEAENDKIFNRELGRLRASLEFLEKIPHREKIVFLHYPPVYRDKTVQEVIDLLAEFHVKRCFYGHLHGASIGHAFNGEYVGIKFRLISADYLKFAPYKIQ
jgi:predicted phosphohydrolase